jgi:hypothetical protein
LTEGKVKIRDLTTEQLKVLIQETVEEKLREMLGDPDQGLELREEVKQRLRESLDAAERGEEGIPVEQVARETALQWE